MAQPQYAGASPRSAAPPTPVRPVVQFVVSAYPPAAHLEAFPSQIGGAELQARRVAQLLRPEFEVRVLTVQPPDQTSSPLIDDEGVRRVPSITTEGHRRALKVFADLVRAGLEEPPPSVIQTSQLNAIAGAAAAIACLRRVPLVIKIAGRANIDKSIGRRRRLQLAALVRSAAAVVAPSQGALAAAVASGIPDSKLHLIPNGVDTDHFRPADARTRAAARAALGYGSDEFVLCWIGRLHPDKGIDCVPPVWGKAEASRPAIRLLLIAQGEQAPIAQALVERHPHSVRWLPFRADLRPIYAAADAIFLTSPSEGLSNVLLEGMASGLPAVVSDAPENVEVGAGEDFILPFDRSSPESQLDALLAAVDCRSRQPLLSAAARRRAEETYSLYSTAARWRALHRALIRR